MVCLWSVWGSDLGEDRRLQFGDTGLVAFVERPLLDALGADQSCPRQDLQMFAHGRLAHAELLGDQYAADPVPDEIAVDLDAEMRPRAFQPLQDQEPAVARKRPQSGLDVIVKRSHIAN